MRGFGALRSARGLAHSGDVGKSLCAACGDARSRALLSRMSRQLINEYCAQLDRAKIDVADHRYGLLNGYFAQDRQLTRNHCAYLFPV